MRCPGQDMRFWKPGDIFETQCPKCGGKIEFFKDDVRRRCGCGHEVVNPKMDLGCAAWCQYAEQCVGDVPEEMKERQRAEEKDLLRERISFEMKRILGNPLSTGQSCTQGRSVCRKDFKDGRWKPAGGPRGSLSSRLG